MLRRFTLRITTGPQYSGDDKADPSGFRAAARLHQSRFRAEVLGVPFDKYGNRLTASAAKSGLNFYSGFQIAEAATKRYPKLPVDVFANMLRSEHIPLNLFIPLNHDDDYRRLVFSALLGKKLRSIGPIRIEYAPSPAGDYLADKTSFDAYAEYEDAAGKPGLVGMEVKYSEREYPLKPGSKEDHEVHDRASKYYKVMNASRLYRAGSAPYLIKDEYRQIWRNQLLGESIVLRHPTLFAGATLMTFFPSRNGHIRRACDGYAEMLSGNESKFAAVTFERFIEICRKLAPSAEYGRWIDFLERRYIVPL